MSANDHVHPIFGAVLGSLLNPVENAKRLEGAMSETKMTTETAYCLRMASYLETMATAQRILASACAIDPLDTEADRVRREGTYRSAAEDYSNMANRYRSMAERSTDSSRNAA